MRSPWGTVVIFALAGGLVVGCPTGRARAEEPRKLVLSPIEQQALTDARQLVGAGTGLTVLGSAAGVSGLVMGSYSLFRDRLPDGLTPAAIGVSIAGPILVGVGVGLLVAGERLEREVRSGERPLAVGPGGFAVRF
jgi:hypothetical protein